MRFLAVSVFAQTVRKLEGRMGGLQRAFRKLLVIVYLGFAPAQRAVDVFSRVGERGVQDGHCKEDKQTYQEIFDEFFHCSPILKKTQFWVSDS
jgi:hypothetical protein